MHARDTCTLPKIEFIAILIPVSLVAALRLHHMYYLCRLSQWQTSPCSAPGRLRTRKQSAEICMYLASSARARTHICRGCPQRTSAYIHRPICAADDYVNRLLSNYQATRHDCAHMHSGDLAAGCLSHGPALWSEQISRPLKPTATDGPERAELAVAYSCPISLARRQYTELLP